LNVSLDGIRVINPAQSEDLDNFANRLFRLRREKGLRAPKRREAMLQPNYYGAMMVAMHQADGLISGASHFTGQRVAAAVSNHQGCGRTSPRFRVA